MADSKGATNNGIETYESIAGENMAELQQIDDFLASKLMDQSCESEENRSLSAGIGTANREMIPSGSGDTGQCHKSSGEIVAAPCKDFSDGDAVPNEIQLLQETRDTEQSPDCKENLRTLSNALVSDNEVHFADTGQSPDGREDVPSPSNVMADVHEVQSLESEFGNTGQNLDSRENLSTCSNSASPKDGDESQTDNLKSDENRQYFDSEEASHAPTTSNISLQREDVEENDPQTEHLEVREVGYNSDEKLTAHLGEKSDRSLQGECKDQEAAVR